MEPRVERFNLSVWGGDCSEGDHIHIDAVFEESTISSRWPKKYKHQDSCGNAKEVAIMALRFESVDFTCPFIYKLVAKPITSANPSTYGGRGFGLYDDGGREDVGAFRVGKSYSVQPASPELITEIGEYIHRIKLKAEEQHRFVERLTGDDGTIDPRRLEKRLFHDSLEKI